MTDHHDPVTRRTGPSDPADVSASHAQELEAYRTGNLVHTNIIALQGQLMTFSNFFLVITGGLWGVTLSDRFGLGAWGVRAALFLHAGASVAALQFVVSTLNAIALRFAFLRDFERRYYPSLAKIGAAAFIEIYHSQDSFKARFGRWGGGVRLFWLTVPTFGLVGSLGFLVRSWLTSGSAS